jgi:16S rRNA (uracil1498-N3)-methyltransferase
MPQVFVSPDAIENGSVHVRGQDAHHLARALRCKVGEPLTVIAGATAYAVVITAVQRDAVDATVLESQPARGEPRLEVTVLQALLPSKDFEDALEYGTEIGVAHFAPLLAERSVPRWDKAAAATKLTRWQAIVRSAAELSGRARIPTVASPQTLEQALETLPKPILFLVGGQRAAPLAKLPWEGSLQATLCVGPEGGFTAAERELALAHDAHLFSLGPRTLRARLAAVVATTLLLQRAGDLEEID